MELFVWALDSEVKSLHRHNVRLRIIGETTRFNARLQERIRKAEALTENNTGLTLNIAANYGGRWDIIQGVRIWQTGSGRDASARADHGRHAESAGLHA
jgi:undecaprenyl diphosphate synthase